MEGEAQEGERLAVEAFPILGQSRLREARPLQSQAASASVRPNGGGGTIPAVLRRPDIFSACKASMIMHTMQSVVVLGKSSILRMVGSARRLSPGGHRG